MSMLRRQFLLGLVSAPLVTLAERAFALDLAEIKALKHGEFIWRARGVSARSRRHPGIAAHIRSFMCSGTDWPLLRRHAQAELGDMKLRRGSLRSSRSARSTIQVLRIGVSRLIQTISLHRRLRSCFASAR